MPSCFRLFKTILTGWDSCTSYYTYKKNKTIYTQAGGKDCPSNAWSKKAIVLLRVLHFKYIDERSDMFFQRCFLFKNYCSVMFCCVVLLYTALLFEFKHKYIVPCRYGDKYRALYSAFNNTTNFIHLWYIKHQGNIMQQWVVKFITATKIFYTVLGKTGVILKGNTVQNWILCSY